MLLLIMLVTIWIVIVGTWKIPWAPLAKGLFLAYRMSCKSPEVINELHYHKSRLSFIHKMHRVRVRRTCYNVASRSLARFIHACCGGDVSMSRIPLWVLPTGCSVFSCEIFSFQNRTPSWFQIESISYNHHRGHLHPQMHPCRALFPRYEEPAI